MKTKNSKSILIKFALIFLLFAFTFVSLAEDNKTTEQTQGNDLIITVIETTPEFPGGMEALMEFIYENLRYPNICGSIQGRVILQFIVEKTGEISNIEVIRSLEPSFDKEAVRVIELMPNWTPGEQRGKKVRVRMVLPIHFKLQ